MGGRPASPGHPGGGPQRLGTATNATSAGLPLANGSGRALRDRERTGEGQWVTTSLIEAQIFMLDFQAARYLMKGDVPGQEGNNHPTAPAMGTFETADGYINVAAAGESLWQRFCDAAGAQELLSDPDYATPVLRAKNRGALNPRMAAIIRQRPSGHWLEVLNKAGVPCGPINTIDQAFADRQVQHLGIATPID